MFGTSAARTSYNSSHGLKDATNNESKHSSTSPPAAAASTSSTGSGLSFLFKRKTASSHEESAADHHHNRQPLESSEILAIRQDILASSSTMTRSSFILGDTLGTGTFGRVRVVTFRSSSNKQYVFALKMLKKSEILRLKQVEHIKAEKSILLQVAHPFIVTLYHAFQDSNSVYMIMEFVPGGELFSQLRKVGRFSENTAKFYAAQIVLALDYLHSKDIVYRDLKPENLLIDRDGNIKITDFGFAKVVTDRTWTLCGTPEYLAPEIIQSKGHGKAVDWWALGVLIYEMLAGYPPYFDESPFGIYQKILSGKLEFPKHVSAEARDLVRKLLTADRSKRLGCLKDGAEDIKQHKFFKGTDWQKVYSKKLKTPYIPQIAANGIDTSAFDRYPDSDDEAQPQRLNDKDAQLFADF